MQSSGSNKRVIVTGADGFLGSNIVRELLSKGYEVYGFIQTGRDALTLRDLHVKLFYGDLNNSNDLIPLFKECDYLIHTAGLTAVWPRKLSSSWDVNYRAVKRLASLSKEHGIKRFIHIGTATSFGPGSLEKPGTECSPYASARLGVDYLDSKFRAQKYLVKKARAEGLPVIILNPTFMLGAYDSGGGSNKMILEIYKQKIPGYTGGGKNYVHVRDVAVAASNALTMGYIGECYIVGNKNMSYREAFNMIASELNVRKPAIPLPKFLALSYGAFNTLKYWLTGSPPSVSFIMARIACSKYYYSSEKAVAELNIPRTSLQLAINDSIDWFKTQGLVS